MLEFEELMWEGHNSSPTIFSLNLSSQLSQVFNRLKSVGNETASTQPYLIQATVANDEASKILQIGERLL